MASNWTLCWEHRSEEPAEGYAEATKDSDKIYDKWRIIDIADGKHTAWYASHSAARRAWDAGLTIPGFRDPSRTGQK